MLETTFIDGTNIVSMTVQGKINPEEQHELIEDIEPFIEKHGKIQLLMDITEYTGITDYDVAAFWENIKFKCAHFKDYSHIAVIGDQFWLSWWSTISSAIMPCEVRTFSPKDKNEALTWLKGNVPSTV